MLRPNSLPRAIQVGQMSERETRVPVTLAPFILGTQCFMGLGKTSSVVDIGRLLTLVPLVVLFAGCSGTAGQNQSAFNRDELTTETPAPDPATLVPPDVLKIPQFPVPPKANVVLGDTVIIGDDAEWSGQVFLTAPYTVIQITQFYRSEMPKVGWVETSIVRSRRTSVSYTRGNRVATLRLSPQRDDPRSTEIDLVISPIQTPATLGQRLSPLQPPAPTRRP